MLRFRLMLRHRFSLRLKLILTSKNHELGFLDFDKKFLCFVPVRSVGSSRYCVCHHRSEGGGEPPPDPFTHVPKIEGGPPHGPRRTVWSKKLGVRRLSQAKKKSFFWWRTTSSRIPSPPHLADL
jgi:hypothetical protein